MFQDRYAEKYYTIVRSESKKTKCIIILIFITFAVVRYFYKWDARMAFEVDESLSFTRAVGFLKTGTFYEWDFFSDQISEISDYTHKGYTILLAIWMKIFGVSLFSARSLSAVLGCLFIGSYVYISFQFFKRWDVTVLSSSFVLLEPNITYWFRFVRFYALLLLLSIWLLFWAYKAITCKNYFKKNNILISFIKKNFDFNFKYCILMVLFGYMSAKIHNVQMVVFGGILLFVVYRAVVYRERKYVIVCVAAASAIFVGCVGLFWGDLLAAVPVLGYFMLSLKYWISFGVWKNVEYYWDSVNAISNQLLMYMGWFLSVISLFSRKKEKEEKEKILYLLLIQVISLVFFVWFANHYYQVRYLCFLLPVSILLFSVGIVEIGGRYLFSDILMGCLMIGCFHYIVMDSYEYLYTLYTGPGSQKVYEELERQYPSEKYILGIDIDMNQFGYFASQQFNDIHYKVWENYSTKTAFTEMREFAEQHPQGIVWVVKNQIHGTNAEQKKFLLDWIDRIAGQGLDNFNIEVGVLHYKEPIDIVDIKPECALKMEPIDLEAGECCTIIVDRSKIAEDAEFICIRLNVWRNDGRIDSMKVQLGVPKEYTEGTLKYEIEIENALRVEIEQQYAVVNADLVIVQNME